MTLESWIDLVETIPVQRNYTPELKTPPAAVPMPFNGYTQEQYARDMVDTFVKKGIDPQRVWPQSFLPDDVFLWIEEYPDTFGPQAVYLDEDGDTAETLVTATARLPDLAARGVKIIAPPFNYLLTTTGEDNQTIVPSDYAITAKEAGLAIIAWSFERSGPLADVDAGEDYYYSTFSDAIYSDGQHFEVLDVLANQIGIAAMFSDWSATTGYFANCFGLKGPVGEDF
jgi:glycerophosphoryl diester phosphodiesterase